MRVSHEHQRARRQYLQFRMVRQTLQVLYCSVERFPTAIYREVSSVDEDISYRDVRSPTMRIRHADKTGPSLSGVGGGVCDVVSQVDTRSVGEKLVVLRISRGNEVDFQVMQLGG